MAVDTRPVNAFTVDLEDWFQGLTSTNPRVDAWPTFPSRVVPMTTLLLQLLETHGVKATFFTLGHVADHHPELIQTIQAKGHEIGVHGYFHRFVNRLTRDEFASEIDRGLEAIQRVSGATALGHRAPYFSIDRRTPWALDVLRERGLRYDSSFHPTRNMLYGYPDAKREPQQVPGGSPFDEFPISTLRLRGQNLPFAGGFYLRTLPYQLVRWSIQRLHREGLPAIIYTHPWELDLAQPRIQVTAREQITHFLGRATLRAKFHRLFTDFRFVPLRELLDTADESSKRSVIPSPHARG
jgi:polysaccharide deacetylase family protein (PEP-CTERM system associated)